MSEQAPGKDAERIWSDSGDRESDFALARLLREQSIAANTLLSSAGVDAVNDERPLTLPERVERLLARVQALEAANEALNSAGKWLRWCDERVLERAEAAEAQVQQLTRERDELQAELDREAWKSDPPDEGKP